jgi:hypothetical protein
VRRWGTDRAERRRALVISGRDNSKLVFKFFRMIQFASEDENYSKTPQYSFAAHFSPSSLLLNSTTGPSFLATKISHI